MNQYGGLATYDREADVKSQMLYNLCDSSGGYYLQRTDKKFRSRMNCVFRMATVELEKNFIEEAEKAAILNISGHVTYPGIRISMYNAMPVAGVVHLCHFMEKFQKQNPVNTQARL